MRHQISAARDPLGTAILRNQIVTTHMTASTRRLQKDYKELKDAVVPLVGVSAAPLDDNFFIWHAKVALQK